MDAQAGRAPITAMMIVYNEADRFLRRVLDDLSQWVAQIVILDDASDDGTGELCAAYPRVTRYERSEKNMFTVNEARLREKLWRLAESARPHWVLAVDADELFEARMRREAVGLVGQDYYDAVEFRMFDMWGGETHYRADGQWDPWSRFNRLLVRYRPGVRYTWPSQPIHCGRLPVELRGGMPVYYSDIRVMHLGWTRPEDHLRKYKFYREWDIKLYGKAAPHTESVIVAPSKVRLERWTVGRELPV